MTRRIGGMTRGERHPKSRGGELPMITEGRARYVARRMLESRSGCELFVFALHQLPDFLERLVQRSAGNMVVGGVDGDAGAGTGFAQFAQKALIRRAVALDVILQIHGLKAE